MKIPRFQAWETRRIVVPSTVTREIRNGGGFGGNEFTFGHVEFKMSRGYVRAGPKGAYILMKKKNT